ncbi:class I adenylate-forming enzyme family protein [Variovorax terrae]|uniref:AMP-binding protein n=1 Tax=Variovorax terrae TaxID=2923278 RepID=A0A9X1VW51_9BURK|nr:AMP-binding protein [Variovorax terrae]MCJ0764896.1 AMP-binding protein [Variovorax terrae]
MVILEQMLTRAARLYGQSEAVVDGAVRLTYAELVERVYRLAAGMTQLGLVAGDRVGLLSRNSFRCIEVNLACSALGLILVPINFRLAAPEIAFIVEDTGLRTMFAEAHYAIHAEQVVTWQDGRALGTGDAYESLIAGNAPVEPRPRSCGAADDIAQIFYTSGTTGRPKGVCLTHGNLVASALDAIVSLELRQRDGWLHASPMFHLVDAFAIWAMTLVGGRHIVTHFSPELFGPLVAAERVTKTSLPPTLLDRIARERSTAASDLSSLELISYGGSPMPDAVYRRCCDALGCALLQAYGLTEGSGFVCHEAVGDNPSPQQVLNTVGRPTLHTQITLVDGQGQPVADDAPGEIWLRGPRVLASYWRNPEATASAFHEGWYRTGDLGKRDRQGRLQIVGRKKEMIISGGENVYPAEVQNVLLAYPGVTEAAVFGLPSQAWGEEVRAVVYGEGEAGDRLREADLLQHCRARIGAYKVPKQIHIAREPLPKNGPGKIATAQVRAQYLLKE